MTTAAVEVRRMLHCNYNCRDLDLLERFYMTLFDLRPLMRTDHSEGVGDPFGLYTETSSKTTFLYDHRGGRRADSLEMVMWTQPPTLGRPYPFPWDRGMQSVGYSHQDLAAVVAQVPGLGGTVVKQSDQALLLRDPEGVSVEVYAQEGPSEMRSIRIVCADLDRSVQWWERIGFTVSDRPVAVTGADIWDGDAAHQIVDERALVAPDDDTLHLVLTSWSGPVSSNKSYGAPYHHGLFRMAMAVDDVQAAYEALLPHGVTVPSPHHFQLPGTQITEGLRIVFIHDPVGILVELVERPRSFFRRD